VELLIQSGQQALSIAHVLSKVIHTSQRNLDCDLPCRSTHLLDNTAGADRSNTSLLSSRPMACGSAFNLFFKGCARAQEQDPVQVGWPAGTRREAA
jgi:hypothetical protein